MTDDEVLDAVTAQRLRLIGRLEALDEAQWDTPSLCAGWRVRDVVGHLVRILDLPLRRFLLGVVKARGFDRFADRAAREYGTQDPAALTARYRERAPKRFSPPVVGPIAPLVDVLVHTRDIERPLGLSSSLDPDGLRTVLDLLYSGKARGFIPARRTAGLRFVATDLDWTVGEGLLVEGPGEALMLAVRQPCGSSRLTEERHGPAATRARATRTLTTEKTPRPVVRSGVDWSRPRPADAGSAELSATNRAPWSAAPRTPAPAADRAPRGDPRLSSRTRRLWGRNPTLIASSSAGREPTRPRRPQPDPTPPSLPSVPPPDELHAPGHCPTIRAARSRPLPDDSSWTLPPPPPFVPSVPPA